MGSRSLSTLTDATGGRTIVLTNKEDIPDAAEDIRRELRTQYVIGYKPSEISSRNGEWRKIKVSLVNKNNDSGVMLLPHYKKGYFTSP